MGRVGRPTIKSPGSRRPWQYPFTLRKAPVTAKMASPGQRVKSSNQSTKVPSPGPFFFPPPASIGGHVQDKQITTPDSVEVRKRKIKTRTNKLKKGKDQVF